MDDVVLNGLILLMMAVGGGLFMINKPGGSGFDIRDWQAGLPVQHRGDRVRRSFKLIPRFRHAATIGAVMMAVAMVLMFLRQ
jgi:hypothetical protein